MTSQYDIDTFANSFDDAVNRIHGAHGHRASSRVWADVLGSASNPRSSRNGPDAELAEEEPTSNTIRQQSIPARRSPRPRRQLPTPGTRIAPWMYTALVGVLVIAMILVINGIPQNGGDDKEIALAPGHGSIINIGPGTPAPTGLLDEATPSGTPDQLIPTYGPEYACNAVPLTTDQVMDYVMNPERASRLLPGTPSAMPELVENDLFNEVWARPWSDAVATDDPELRAELTDFANEFWTCLMTGTAYQVWALSDPHNVQFEILKRFPVLRDEESIREYVEWWGPKRYSAGLTMVFPDLGNWEPEIAEQYVRSNPSAIRITARAEELHDPDIAYSTLAVVTMEGTWKNGTPRYIDLQLQRTPDGSWWVSRVVWIDWPLPD